MKERTTTIMLLYDTAEQLKTVLHFLEPVTVSHREEPGLYGKQKRSYITVQV